MEANYYEPYKEKMTLPILKKSEVRRAINAKIKPEIDHGKHEQGWVYFEGKKCFKIYIPFGRGDLGKGTLHKIIKQSKITRSEFISLVDCPFTGTHYYERLVVLRSENII